MADFNDNLHKGEVLMQQALKKYEDGDFEHGDKDRKEANHFFDLASKEINSEEGQMSQLYGESRNFGIIYNVFEQNIDNLLETKEGRKIIKEMYDLIKGNKILSEQFKIYDFFEKAKNVDNIKEFVAESTQIISNFDKKAIKENNDKLISIIRKGKLDEYVEIPEEIENLYEAIEYIILNKKNLNNINEYVNAQTVISEHIKKNNSEAILENKDNKTLIDDLKDKINEEQKKADDMINEDEKKLVESFLNEKENHRVIFNKYKESTLSKINEMIEKADDAEDKEGWKNIYEDISSRTFSENATENITNCAEMLEITNTINE